VRAVLGKVIGDQVDAGLVYATDVRVAGDKVVGIAIPAKDNVFKNYSIAVVSDSRNAQAARAFVDFVRDTRSAQEILRSRGFTKPW
jgi:molybdate transport system substrate-binding protein